MVSEIIRPDSTIYAVWNISNHENVDEVVEDPDEGDGNFVEADKDDDDNTLVHGLGNLTESYGGITSLKLVVLTGDAIDDEAQVFLYVNGAELTKINLGLASDPNTYYDVTDNGSWTVDQINSAQVRYHCDNGISGSKVIQIDAVYVVVTGTEPASQVIIAKPQ